MTGKQQHIDLPPRCRDCGRWVARGVPHIIFFPYDRTGENFALCPACIDKLSDLPDAHVGFQEAML